MRIGSFKINLIIILILLSSIQLLIDFGISDDSIELVISEDVENGIASPGNSRSINQYQIPFSTYFGGSSHDKIYDSAIDSDGNSYYIGTTFSNDFPTTEDAYNGTPSVIG